MIDVGQYSTEVNEVVEFVRNGGVLSGYLRDVDLAEAGIRFRVIESCENLEIYRNPDCENAEIVGASNWTDIKRKDEGRFREFVNELPGFKESHWPRIESLAEELLDVLESNLREYLPEYEIEEIADDIEALLFHRAALGIVDGFTEDLFRVYKANGFPCGWSGEYPNGTLVVLSIRRQDTNEA